MKSWSFLSLSFFPAFCGTGIDTKSNKKIKAIPCLIALDFVYLLFPLMEKVTKKSSEFDAVQSLKSKSPLTNSHLGESFRPKGLRTKTQLRAIRSN